MRETARRAVCKEPKECPSPAQPNHHQERQGTHHSHVAHGVSQLGGINLPTAILIEHGKRLPVLIEILWGASVRHFGENCGQQVLIAGEGEDGAAVNDAALLNRRVCSCDSEES